MSAPKRPAACTAVDKIRITGQDPRQIDDKKGLPTVIIDPKSGSPVDSVYMPMVTVRLVDGLGAEVAPSARGRAKDEAKLAKGLAKDKDTKAKVANGEYKVVAEYSSVIFFPAKAGAELEKFAESIFTVEANYTLKEFQKAHFAYLQNVKERKGRFIDPLTGVARAVYTEGAKAVDEEDEMAALGGGDQEAKVAGDFVCRSVKVSAQTQRPRGDALGEASALSDLCAFFVDAPPEERKRGEVSSTPILLVCGPGEGKSVMLTTLAFEIAISCELESLRCGGPLDKKGNQPPWQGALPLLPISLESAKLLRIIYGRRDPLLECDLDGTPLALLEYVASDFAGDEPRVRLLKAALRLRACVLLIDDFDFSISKGRASQLRSFLVGTVAHQHYRMVVACRSTQYVDQCAVDWPGFVRMDVLPLQPREQEKVVELQLRQFGQTKARWLPHMLHYAQICAAHDKLYCRALEEPERERIEGMTSYDRFKHGAHFLPEGRAVAFNGDGKCVRIPKELKDGGAPKSDYWKELGARVAPALLTVLDEEMAKRAESGVISSKLGMTDEQAQAIVCECAKDAPTPRPGEKADTEWFERAAAPHHRFLKRLVLLARRRQILRPMGENLGATTCKALWQQLVWRTEELYVVSEKYRDLAQAALVGLINDVPQLGGSVTIGDDISKSSAAHLQHLPPKDAVSIHEHACDEFHSRFKDGELAEACTTDVLRSTLIINEPTKQAKGVLAEALYFVSRAKQVNMGGFKLGIDCMRRDNMFTRDGLHPTHHRTCRLVLRFTFAPSETKKGSRQPDFIYWELTLLYRRAPLMAPDGL